MEQDTQDPQTPNPGDEAPADAPGVGEDLCRACHGSGKVEGAQCAVCGGTGKVLQGIGGG
jgi:RecJ-like exonuclease